MYRSKIELHNVDCLPFMKQCEDKQFDLAIVDPPYGLKRFDNLNGNCSKFATKKLQNWDVKPTSEYFNELFRISKNQIVWGGNNFELPTSEYFIIWHKSNKLNFTFAMCEQAWTNIRKPAKMFIIWKKLEEKIKYTQHKSLWNCIGFYLNITQMKMIKYLIAI